MKRNKKIVVFGPDNSGKTTLVSNILYVFPLFYSSHSLGPVSVEEMLKYTEDNLNSGVSFVFDRFPMIEEMTCGKVLRNENKFSNMLGIVHKCFEKVDLFIYCDPGIKVITDWKDREQMDGVKENIYGLKNEYDKLYKIFLRDGKNIVKYNWTKGEKEFNKIIERINEI